MNLGGIACVSLFPITQVTKAVFGGAFSNIRKAIGLYTPKDEQKHGEIRVYDKDGDELIRFSGLKDLSYTKNHGILFTASNFKITDDGKINSRWLIHELEPTADEIFEEMRPTFMQISQSKWCSKEHIRCLNEVTEKLKSFKKNNIIKVKKGKNGPSKSNCWMPKH